METPTPRFAFDVIIGNTKYGVYDIPGREHAGANDTVKTWWLYFTSPLPHGMIPPADSPNFIPYHAWIRRRCWEVSFKDFNTTKEKWDDRSFSHHTACEIKCNGQVVHAFSASDMTYAMAKAQVEMVKIQEHVFDFLHPEKEVGRLIFFYGLPAKIRSVRIPGEITIEPDYSTGIDEDRWWILYKQRKSPVGGDPDTEWAEMEADQDLDDRQDGYINWGSVLSDQHINWSRGLYEKKD